MTPRPTYNHTRGDSALTPCSECAALAQVVTLTEQMAACRRYLLARRATHEAEARQWFAVGVKGRGVDEQERFVIRVRLNARVNELNAILNRFGWGDEKELHVGGKGDIVSGR